MNYQLTARIQRKMPEFSKGQRLIANYIEEHYDEVVDELWYVYASEQVRYKRLKDSRGYSDEKTASIISRQQPDAVFRSKCDFVLDNSGDFENTKQQIDEKLGVYLCKEQTASSIS